MLTRIEHKLAGLDNKRTNIGGFSIYTRVKNIDQNPTLVLIHGIGASSRYWLPLFRYLKNHYSVIAIDLPGFGNSSKPKDILATSDHANILADIVANLNDVVLIGNSYGCQIIIELLYQSRLTNIKGTVLIGPTTNSAERTTWKQIMRWAQNGRYEPIWSIYLFVADFVHSRSRRMYRTLQHAVNDKPEKKITQISVPLIILRGKNDPIVTAVWARNLAKLAKNGRFATVGTGHASHINATKSTAGKIRQFTNSL